MRLLLVEDAERLADATARGLRSHGHAVDLAPTLAAARRQIRLESYDAVLLDLGLPDGDGTTLLAELRRAGATTPVIVLTARDGVEDRVGGLDLGADDYLVKPFALAELEARLRAIARRTPEWRPDLIEIDTLRLDPATRRAWRDGQELALTTTEFALLEFLARHAGEVLGRQRISEKVWDAHYDPASNIIDVYIARLRRKLDTPAARPLLHTIRGAGYSLDPARGP
ncbi:MAG TPA: response regulator transcription factor [Gemmatimonadales bacterium]|nr:response regulator transcription factor [Gemmatimonadales bacterium]